MGIKRIAEITGIAVSGVLVATVLAPSAAGDLLYGAFAYSPSTGVIGTATNYPDFRPAARRAMQECENHYVHPTDCQWVMSAPDCLVLAIGPDKSVFAAKGGLGMTLEQAEAQAVAAVGPGGLSAWRLCNGTDMGPVGDNGIWRD